MNPMSVTADAIRDRFRRLALVEIDPMRFLPSGSYAQIAGLLFEAADVVDEIFWRQVSPDQDKSSLLAQAGDDQELRELLLFNYGPYDRLNNNAPLLDSTPKAPGAGFYPIDLTQKEFADYIRDHPESKKAFESPYTVIRRESTGLVAVPYHDAYQEQVGILSGLLYKASLVQEDSPFHRFLAQRAKDVRTDDYHESDGLWTALRDCPMDLVVGPIEAYEDRLIGLKAAYEAMVLSRDLEESGKISHLWRDLPSLCKSLERESGKSLKIEGTRVALSVENLMYAGGDARKAIPAVGFTLPNDERVIEGVGARQVILKNILEGKFHGVVWPIVNCLLGRRSDDQDEAFQSFFEHVLFHEISHSIGPHRITVDGHSTTVNRSLMQYHSVLEELKADILGACFVLILGDVSHAERFLETYVADCLRAVRFGLSEAHGGANAIQLNYLLRESALTTDKTSGRLTVDPVRARKALLRLSAEIIDIQSRGDFAAAKAFVSVFCVHNPDIEALLRRVSDLPIDIRVRYKTL